MWSNLSYLPICSIFNHIHHPFPRQKFIIQMSLTWKIKLKENVIEGATCLSCLLKRRVKAPPISQRKTFLLYKSLAFFEVFGGNKKVWPFVPLAFKKLQKMKRRHMLFENSIKSLTNLTCKYFCILITQKWKKLTIRSKTQIRHFGNHCNHHAVTVCTHYPLYPLFMSWYITEKLGIEGEWRRVTYGVILQIQAYFHLVLCIMSTLAWLLLLQNANESSNCVSSHLPLSTILKFNP